MHLCFFSNFLSVESELFCCSAPPAVHICFRPDIIKVSNMFSLFHFSKSYVQFVVVIIGRCLDFGSYRQVRLETEGFATFLARYIRDVHV